MCSSQVLTVRITMVTLAAQFGINMFKDKFRKDMRGCPIWLTQ